MMTPMDMLRLACVLEATANLHREAQRGFAQLGKTTVANYYAGQVHTCRRDAEQLRQSAATATRYPTLTPFL